MNYKDLFEAITKAGQGLADAWLFKTLIAFIVAVITSVHGSAFLAFVVLIFIDLATRWVAISYKHLQDCGKPDDLFSCLLNIRSAITAGRINSDAMKHRFAGKLILYMALTAMAVNVDSMLRLAGETPLILKVAWVYLAATEAISVLENLRDAGVEQAGSLLDFLRSRLSVWLEKFKTK